MENNYQFASKINGTDETGIICIHPDGKGIELICLCTKQKSELLLKLLNGQRKKKQPKEKESLRFRCIEIYKGWCYQNDKVFDFNGLQGKSLDLIIEKIIKGYADKFNKVATDDNVCEGFSLILQYLPQWYKDNNFSLSVINSKYASIISQIKNGAAKKAGFDLDKAHATIDRVFDVKSKS